MTSHGHSFLVISAADIEMIAMAAHDTQTVRAERREWPSVDRSLRGMDSDTDSEGDPGRKYSSREYHVNAASNRTRTEFRRSQLRASNERAKEYRESKMQNRYISFLKVSRSFLVFVSAGFNFFVRSPYPSYQTVPPFAAIIPTMHIAVSPGKENPFTR